MRFVNIAHYPYMLYFFTHEAKRPVSGRLNQSVYPHFIQTPAHKHPTPRQTHDTACKRPRRAIPLPMTSGGKAMQRYSVRALVSPEEKRHRTGSCMASYSGPHAVDKDPSVELWKPGLNKVRNRARILIAARI